MKYLTIILCVLLASCTGYIPNHLVVRSFTSFKNNLCEYEVSTKDGIRTEAVIFIDTCGLYKIGDTLTLKLKQ